jgi:hypothetical protein
VQICVAYADYLGNFRVDGAVKTVDLQEESVYDYLSLIKCQYAGLQIGFQVWPRVLIKPAK